MEREKNPLYDVAVCELHGRQNNFYDEDGTIKCSGCFPIEWGVTMCFGMNQDDPPPPDDLGLSQNCEIR